MRYRETHFEQVPIAVVETVLRQATALEIVLDKSPAPVSAIECQVITELLKQADSTPLKGPL